ncbi:glycerol-3-phosphate acyltransferase PlsY [Catalinimonas alkaloidigena]|uniref:glycerol-3-phosphate 1-O-acyltransferase PlsY n=1 Tax=Catalinimonas alkaloidigena TaxID=1075417 RepID=UPI002404F9D1|nr:glycerol-3-phosphate 1-O-acyltransferase PlsY [Catalinimonas alkaloidigena]MDF9800623.1 glycerol-3-phosphate acyltransferase PlsY [Catalinimonas alkaloidigena]
MNIIWIILSLIVAYLLGSIPTAVWYGLRFHGVDVRKHGSGNAGATNTFRVLGKRAGSIVMLVDILKGLTATMLAFFLIKTHAIDSGQLVEYKLLLGVIAVIGHVFPLYTNFKGGKGVATLLGMVVSLQPWVALSCIVVFLLTLTFSKYVSLSSLLATLAFPLLLMVPPFKTDEPILIFFGFLMFVVLAITHKKNIVRLLNGDENRTYLWAKKD